MSRAPVIPREAVRGAAADAACAIAGLLGVAGTARAGDCHPIEADRVPPGLFEPGQRVTVVFADLRGGPGGPAGLMLTPEVLERVLDVLVGDATVKTLDERSCSALCELGNIAISAAASALARWLGETVWPSVPRIGFEKDPESPLAELCGASPRSPGYVVEIELGRADGALRIPFVWVPGP